MNKQEFITKANEETKGFSAEQVLKYAADKFPNELTFAHSLGEEDQIILDMIDRNKLRISVFTLDTGRVFPESYDLLKTNKEKYQTPIRIMFPDFKKVEEMVNEKGINLFYESIENRKLCCGIRKIEPLQRALSGNQAWITGLRRSQSITRAGIEFFEIDTGNDMIKINPLAYWSYDDVTKYIRENDVPINPLHAQGFVSIGCQPCTRAIKPGDDIRAGRWWWEQPEQKECGLHNNPNRPK